MKTFKEFIAEDKHQHPTFDKVYACYMAYLGRESRSGSQSAKQEKVCIEGCRKIYREIQAQGTASQARSHATNIVRNAIDQHADVAGHIASPLTSHELDVSSSNAPLTGELGQVTPFSEIASFTKPWNDHELQSASSVAATASSVTSCSNTEQYASTTPPGTPPMPASLWCPKSPPSYVVNPNPSTSPATDSRTPTANTESAANFITSTNPLGSTLELNISKKGHESASGSSVVPVSSSTTDTLPAHSDSRATGTAEVHPTSPDMAPGTPPSDGRLDINEEERTALLSEIEKVTHTCPPQEGETCSTCKFKIYQRLCVEALMDNQLKITDIADVVSLIGITPEEWDAVDFDEGLPMKAVRLSIQNRKDDIAQILLPMNRDHRPIRIMLETLLEYLPKEEDRSISEYEFTVKHIGPVMQAFFQSKAVTSHFPNKDSSAQKKLGLRPDRPDFTATAGKKEIAWGEFSGPAHEHDEWKNNWDFFRDVRYGKAFLDSGYKIAPLFQIVYEKGNYMRLQDATRGMYILSEVGQFTIPSTTSSVASLIAGFPILFVAKNDIENIAKGPFNILKRSWGYRDLDKSKLSLIQRPGSAQKKRKSTSDDSATQQADGDQQTGQGNPDSV
ncbi:hypothetical protein BGX21_002554 [Mortierella sp. AD011]|nr:hypothetical protein BGX20_002370 [Mortierella sp. AD010]KAF9379756.1 hypothetical protein BGX21_002554 [Mortierella sp. AD011]